MKDSSRKADAFSLGYVFSEMLTVRQRMPLVDYRTARFVAGTDYWDAFRNNLSSAAN
jgi:hypothetical protein